MKPVDSRQLFTLWGTVTDVAPGMIRIKGLNGLAGVGDEIVFDRRGQRTYGEILTVSQDSAMALLFSADNPIRVGERIDIHPRATVRIGDHWLGNIVDYRGEVAGREGEFTGEGQSCDLHAPAPAAHTRRGLGARVRTGWIATDTLLPICRGQRLGLFAGSGVGKSTFLGSLAGGIDADRVVIALIGERSREVNEFIRKTLPESVRPKTVIVAATASEPPGAKKRAALVAMAAAEHFRDQGHHVMFLFDSITRFAEAHRETALLAGETPALNAFPPSTVRVISELAERSGPGAGTMGDITAIYSVLVQGSDMEEPVADMMRGILDGHIILSRDIAERGRYPAVDVLRSVSRSLPGAATNAENALLKDYRRLIALYDEVAPMLRANLYEFGKDPETDRAITLFPALDGLISEKATDNAAAYKRLGDVLGAQTP